jgi:hypothetical protein
VRDQLRVPGSSASMWRLRERASSKTKAGPRRSTIPLSASDDARGRRLRVSSCALIPPCASASGKLILCNVAAHVSQRHRQESQGMF